MPRTSFLAPLHWLLRPISEEKEALLAERWKSLPEELKTENQVVGRHMVHCGYTLGPSYCSFGCTHCYLPTNANRAPLPSLAEMREQIDANRRLLGPQSGLQITGGDVVDAYWKADRAEELVEILAYTNSAGLVPMLMTHGQVLLENPDYFATLVRRGGLRKLALHIDITQAGRPGYPIGQLRHERDLHPLRRQFVELILRTRRATGKSFAAAMTVTVCERNLEGVADLVGWLCSDPLHLKAFRMLSLQTEAPVGRTRFSTQPVTPDRVWAEACRGAGLELARDNLAFGDPECSNMSTVAVLFPSGRTLDLIPGDAPSRKYWQAVLEAFGGVGSRGVHPWEDNLRRLGLLLRNPRMLSRTLTYARHLGRRSGIGARTLLTHFLGGRVSALNLVMHNFMGAEEMAEPRSRAVERRLAACSFKGAVKRGEAWEAVPMCSMNALEREGLYARKIDSIVPDRISPGEIRPDRGTPSRNIPDQKHSDSTQA